MHFPHDGNIVTIGQLSFVKTDHRMNPSHHTSLNVPHVVVVPSLCLTCLLTPDIMMKFSHLKKTIFFPLRGILGGMSSVRGKPMNLSTSCWLRASCEHSFYYVSILLKNEMNSCEHSSLYVPISLNMKQILVSIVPFMSQAF